MEKRIDKTQRGGRHSPNYGDWEVQEEWKKANKKIIVRLQENT